MKNAPAKVFQMACEIANNSLESGHPIDRLTLVYSYVTGYEAAINEDEHETEQTKEPAPNQPYMFIERDSEGNATGVRINALGESFLVTLHDHKDKVTWAEACELNAPVRKQAAIMEAVWDELNDMLEQAGGDRFDKNKWYLTKSQYNGNYVWLFDGNVGRLNNYYKSYSHSVRPVLA